MAEGFLARWSQRKQAERAGQTLREPPATAIAPPMAQPQPEAPAAAALPAAHAAPAPALTLEQARALTSESDFAPFVARDVAPEVRNAAMKTLFADPHYQVMDRLDTYIDDYSQADPLPVSMLRQMASAKFLQLFEEEDKRVEPEPLADQPSPAPGTHHDHTDLRLQPDDAAGRAQPGRSAE